ncbi:MAG: hypothetical protein EBV06_12340 [Planctomycetia bacterium]|nr:hypothetical protein [Planctomycetia bacterium]
MIRLKVFVTFLTLALLGTAFSQDKDAPKEKDKDKDKPSEKAEDKKLKGFLPAGFKKLGLTDKQVQAIYKIQTDYRGKKDDLTKQLAKLKDAEREEIEKVLTDAQKKELKAIRTGEKKDK